MGPHAVEGVTLVWVVTAPGLGCGVHGRVEFGEVLGVEEEEAASTAILLTDQRPKLIVATQL